jgi:hypothetical protein
MQRLMPVPAFASGRFEHVSRFAHSKRCTCGQCLVTAAAHTAIWLLLCGRLLCRVAPGRDAPSDQIAGVRRSWTNSAIRLSAMRSEAC